MKAMKMHADEVLVDTNLARRLLAAQFPPWAGLPLAPVPSAGTDNALFRLGATMVMRFPRIYWAVDQVDLEQRWLPWLAPQLPLAIPTPLAKGDPDGEFPWPWSIYGWLDGEDAVPERNADLLHMAHDLAQFILALQRIDPAQGPRPGSDDLARGKPLGARDARTRDAIASVSNLLDAGALTAAWEAALDAPAWPGPPVWLHGDLRPGNFLFRRGRLGAVIDFGCLGVGDPACDMQVAWNLFSGASREAFRAALAADDATWARGRGWALSLGLIALPYYQHTNPELAEISRRAIENVLADDRRAKLR